MVGYAILMLITACTLLMGQSVAMAQNPLNPDVKKKEEELPPDPLMGEVVQSADGLKLVYDFYPSRKGKETVPVLMFHDYLGSRKDLALAALLLQSKGYAVLTPDLRGHGDSTKFAAVRPPLIAEKLRANDFDAMMLADFPALKSVLMKMNNKAELNIEKLCLVGAEMGAVLAVQCAMYDWSRPQFAGKKNGRDVRGVVLLSPPLRFAKGGRFNSMQPFIARPVPGSWQQAMHNDLSIMIVVGKQDSGALKAANAIDRDLDLLHAGKDDVKDVRKQSLFTFKPKTSLQGIKMLNNKSLGVAPDMAVFCRIRLVENKEFAWTDRTSVLDQ